MTWLAGEPVELRTGDEIETGEAVRRDDVLYRLEEGSLRSPSPIARAGVGSRLRYHMRPWCEVRQGIRVSPALLCQPTCLRGAGTKLGVIVHSGGWWSGLQVAYTVRRAIAGDGVTRPSNVAAHLPEAGDVDREEENRQLGLGLCG